MKGLIDFFWWGAGGSLRAPAVGLDLTCTVRLLI